MTALAETARDCFDCWCECGWKGTLYDCPKKNTYDRPQGVCNWCVEDNKTIEETEPSLSALCPQCNLFTSRYLGYESIYCRWLGLLKETGCCKCKKNDSFVDTRAMTHLLSDNVACVDNFKFRSGYSAVRYYSIVLCSKDLGGCGHKGDFISYEVVKSKDARLAGLLPLEEEDLDTPFIIAQR